MAKWGIPAGVSVYEGPSHSRGPTRPDTGAMLHKYTDCPFVDDDILRLIDYIQDIEQAFGGADQLREAAHNARNRITMVNGIRTGVIPAPVVTVDGAYAISDYTPVGMISAAGGFTASGSSQVVDSDVARVGDVVRDAAGNVVGTIQKART